MIMQSKGETSNKMNILSGGSPSYRPAQWPETYLAERFSKEEETLTNMVSVIGNTSKGINNIVRIVRLSRKVSMSSFLNMVKIMRNELTLNNTDEFFR